MEITVVYWGYTGIVEKGMETAIVTLNPEPHTLNLTPDPKSCDKVEACASY